MYELAEKLIQQALGLPAEDRAELVRVLIDSLDESDDTDFEAAWDAELRRRIERVEQGKSRLRLALEALSEIRDKYNSVECF